MYEGTPRGIYVVKMNTIITLVTIKHVKRRQPLNEDVFEVSVLHFLMKLKPFDNFFPSKT